MRNYFGMVKGFGIFGIVLSLVGVGITMWQGKMTNDVCKKVGMTVDELVNSTPVDIQQAVVERAVKNAADREVKKEAESMAKTIGTKMGYDMKEMIRKDVDNAYDSLKDGLRDHIDKEIKEVDVKAIIEKTAAELVLKEFRNISGIAGLFGNSGNRSVDFSGLKDVLNTLPSYERSSVLEAFAKRY